MSDLIPPDGKMTGCLPRMSAFGGFCPAFSDKIEVIPRENWSEFIGEITLRPHVTEIFDQDGEGSCATESTTQALEIVRSFQGQPYIRFNPWSIYCFTRARGGGSSIDENLRHIRQIGILPMAVWPRSKGANQKPPIELLEMEASKYKIDEFYDLATIDEVGTALIKGFPVVFGWRGHSCVLTALWNRDSAEYANSWAPTWGDKGFGRIKLSAIDSRYGMFAVRTTLDSGSAERSRQQELAV